MKKRIKAKIGVGSVVKANFGDLEKIKREGRISRMRKEVVGCVQYVVGGKYFLFQFKYVQKKNIGYSSLLFLSSKEEVEMDEPLLNYPKNNKI